MPAGNLGCCTSGSTASRRRIATSHEDDQHCRHCLFGRSYHAHQHSFREGKLGRAISPSHLVILIICLFTQHATALALVGKTRPSRFSASTPLLIDESATPGFGHEAYARTGGMELSKRQMQSTIATDTSSASSTSFPQPFDGGLGNNFTAPSCPLYFQNFLNDPTFQSCHAISMLLVTSQGFFQSSRNAKSVNDLLQASCSVDLQSCKSVMNRYATGIKAQGACGADYTAQNPNVLEAYQGFVAYESVFNATCQKSSSPNGYCFTDAITNASSPTSSYVYYLPLGLSLPASTQPTCNKCLETTMNNYATYAGNGSLPLSSVYGSAVQTMDLACGPQFVQASVPKVVGAAGRTHFPSLLFTILTALTVAVLW